jgi:hypothetical protein
MRRPRDVGIMMVMLLGLSGCAGMQQQGGWASPSGASGYGAGVDERPLARLAWWRRTKADSETTSADASAMTNPGRPGLLASDSASAPDASSARPSLLRRFALLGQRLTGTKGDDSDSNDLPASWKRGSPASGPVTTAFAAPASSRAASGSTASVSSAASAPAGSNRISGSMGEVALDLSGKKPQIDASAIPAGHTGTSASSVGDSESAPPVPFTPDADQQSPATGRPAPGPAPDQELIPPAPIAQPAGSPSGSPPSSPPLTSSSKPAIPSVSPDADQPASAGTPGQPGGKTLIQQQAGFQPSWSSSPVSSLGSGQLIATTSGQTAYTSPTYVESTGKKCNLLEKLCPLKKHHQPLPSAQVLPTSQSCDTATTVKVKKPCFLKTLIHKKTCPGKGCGCAGDGCEAHTLTASPQSTWLTPQ